MLVPEALCEDIAEFERARWETMRRRRVLPTMVTLACVKLCAQICLYDRTMHEHLMRVGYYVYLLASESGFCRCFCLRLPFGVDRNSGLGRGWRILLFFSAQFIDEFWQ